MKLQKDAINVLSRASAYLQSGVLSRKPVWFDIVEKYPPTHNLIKKPYIKQAESQDPRNDLLEGTNQETQQARSHVSQLFKTRSTKLERSNRNNNIHRAPKLKFIEDELRNFFHSQHPWELARPKTLIENKGDEISRKCDWSHMLQLQKPLDGESVVQRTMYIIQNDPEVTDIFDAYDMARFEYYKLRMAEEMESHIAREESAMHGAVFESTHADWNLRNEQNYIDDWVKLAGDETKFMEANANKSRAPVGSMVEGEEKSTTSMFEDLLSAKSTVPDIEYDEGDTKL
ncbi:RSM25 [Candida oxycetoniae]|uniref:37S ribosomal protein S25, mitochondrial n=1 Tax=Candida oxycetoniae TaxID=497107 RepID=A0AAI9WW39_9ASCO|nr:RSM25 [Candida oxycetoniae]KAI3402815.2 RSM25 [Candida oxycetoniae]